MPLPTRRHSRARKNKRRTHDTLKPPHYILCPQCHEPKLPHRVCPKCGAYKGRTVIEIEEVS
ncbi:MAG: 50S ribosomal protein L32 [Proteobacteria bacterium]|nr:50S ribosomal protein L32 [Pseudomonadota bacterium]HUT83914.1 50S ribosomal protein L32 [Thermodesulfobacteriota bacterium]